MAIDIDIDIEAVIAEIQRRFADRGDSAYGSEAVSQREHALQAAALARQSGADASGIVAALLHDVGHLLHYLPADASDTGLNDRHEELAHHWLSQWFGDEVLEPIRLHVAAKRYLCKVESDYQAQLSRPSVISLGLQGGPMSAEEVRQFETSPHYRAAVALRRWDDQAKVPGLAVPGVESYSPELRAALTGSRNLESKRS